MSEDKLNRIENKLDEVVSRIGSIDVTLGMQEVSLADHIRRTELLENDLKPIKIHVAMISGALKLLGLSSVIVSIIYGITRIIAH